jgi:hypothetical protein
MVLADFPGLLVRAFLVRLRLLRDLPQEPEQLCFRRGHQSHAVARGAYIEAEAVQRTFNTGSLDKGNCHPA